MSIKDFRDYLAAQTGDVFYPLSFPTSSPNNCSIVSLSGGSTPQGGVVRTTLQVISRADHPATGEQLALKIKNVLDQSTSFNAGSIRVIFCAAANPFPLYLGTDENQLYKFSMNYNLILEV